MPRADDPSHEIAPRTTPTGPEDRRPPPCPEDAYRTGAGLFFVVGTGRCGSTLLQAMLLCHPRIAIPPETFFFALFDPALRHGDPLPEERIDAWLAECAAEPVWRELGVPEAELAAAVRGGVRDARGLFLWLMRRLLGPEDAARPLLGEKTPRHEQCVARIHALFPEARFVHIHRDPRDVVASLLEMSWRSSGSATRLAKECRRTYRRQARFAAELGPERHLTLRYEDLVADPETQLRRVCAFLGESFDPAMLRFPERRAAGYVASESGWKDLTRAPLDPSRVGRYRDRLRPGQIRRVEHVLRRELPALGYARTRPVLWRPAWWWAELGDARRRRRSAGRRRRA